MNLGFARLTLAELRAVGRAYRWAWTGRRGVPAGVEARTPDETVLDLFDRPFESVADAAARLGAAERHLRERGDRRSVFLTVYAAMTETVHGGLQRHRFADPAWVEAYLVAFAERYRAAFVAFESGRLDEVPSPWLVGFDASLGGETLVIQDALLGVNAHINYDLAHTLCDVGIDPDRASKRADHDAVNGVLADLVDAVQSALAATYAAEGLTDADELLGRADETATLRGLTEARHLAWANAALRTDAGTEWTGKYVDWRVRLVATGLAYAVFRPGTNPALVRRLREFERAGSPLDVVADACRATVRDAGG